MGSVYFSNRDMVSPRCARSIDCCLAMRVQSVCATGIRPDHDDSVRAFPIDPSPPATSTTAEYLLIHRAHRNALVSCSCSRGSAMEEILPTSLDKASGS